MLEAVRRYPVLPAGVASNFQNIFEQKGQLRRVWSVDVNLSLTTLLRNYQHGAVTHGPPAHLFISWRDNDKLIKIIAGGQHESKSARRGIASLGSLIERKPSQVGAIKLHSGYWRDCSLLRPHSFLVCRFVRKAGQIARNGQSNCRFKLHFSLLPLRYQTKPAHLNFLSKIRLGIMAPARFWFPKRGFPLDLQGSVTSLHPPSSSLSISIKYIIKVEVS